MFGLFLCLGFRVAAEEFPNNHSILSDSFEQADASGIAPAGWHFEGSPQRQEKAWTTEQPFEGKRALRLSGLEGAQRWTSSSYPVKGGQRYLLEWQARYHGEKRWRFLADFSGVETSFEDAQGKVLGRESQHTDCWQTMGWRPGWLLFETPPQTSGVRIQFSLQMQNPLPGGFDVDFLQLRPYPETTSSHEDGGIVVFRPWDSEGRPTGARFRIKPKENHTPDQGNKESRPKLPGCIVYGMASDSFHPPVEGTFEAVLPPDEYTVVAAKGFEYAPWVRDITVGQAGPDPMEMEVHLERRYDWRKRGWYSGDHHNHLYRHGGSLFTSLGVRDVLRCARCEGLDFLAFMGEARRSTERDERPELCRQDLVAELNDEIADDFWGHVCPIGVSDLARSVPRLDAGPMNFDRDAAISGEGGFLCFGHPYGPIELGHELEAVANPKAGLMAREFPVDLALGMHCGLDVLAMEGSENRLDLKLRDLYGLYNLGFRPTLTASTDFHIDQGRQPVGAVRTYVHCSQLNMAEVAKGYREGRTFVTNGPLLDLKVEGKGPGDEIVLQGAGAVLNLTCEAVSLAPLDRLEILVNGKTFKTFPPDDPNSIRAACEIPVQGSAWIAAKVTGPETPLFASSLEGRPLGAGQIAHTSPIFVLLDGRPALTATAGEAGYFAKWCEAAIIAWEGHLAETPEDRSADALVRQRLTAAAEVYRSLELSLAAR